VKLSNDVTSRQFLDAVREGVHDAEWQMITNATMMPCADFFDTIKDAVKEAVSEAVATVDIEEAIKQGVVDSMPYASEIMSAITDGVKEAYRERAKP
jgi:hypothetical protein